MTAATEAPAVTLRRAAAELRDRPGARPHDAPLADWLESTADEAERHAAQGWGNIAEEYTDGHPINTAHAVLGKEA